ncbi:MAG: hypothetical protein Tsb0016_00110 [Sphingomonadales bacterium]
MATAKTISPEKAGAPDQAGLPARPIVLVGLMGCGKTSVGRRLADRLGWPFIDSDVEIEQAAGCSINEIFERFGEPAFRDGERRVIRRLLDGAPKVIATGGGAFMDPDTRALIKAEAMSVWLKADIDVLVERTSRRNSRPLLLGKDAKAVLSELAARRYPHYGEADITISSGRGPHEAVVNAIIAALKDHAAMTTNADAARQTVAVALAGRAYDIEIGPHLLRRAGDWIAPLLARPRTVIVTDQHVADRHLPTLASALSHAGIDHDSIVLPPGEGSKTFAQLDALCARLLALEVERRDIIIALGGGVIGDLTGFAAAILRRGIDFIQIPTTLLAQVDSAVGGKTGINTALGKNLIGAFHQPRLVLADTAVLDSLPKRELLAGYAEVVKYGLLGDAAFFAWLERHGEALLAGDQALRAQAIATCCRAKAAIVARDERETGDRALLNLGHSFGHALEAAGQYDGRLLHGEAVAIGMAMALHLSRQLGYCGDDDVARTRAHLRAVGLPLHPRQRDVTLEPDQMIDLMRQDKKVADGRIVLILARGIGQAYIDRDVDLAALRHAIDSYLSEERPA